jgi:glutaminyl-tRNA synthetase
MSQGRKFTDNLNRTRSSSYQHKLEPSVAGAAPGSRYQFERLGYFCVDRDSTPQKLLLNRTVALRDAWAKIEKKTK